MEVQDKIKALSGLVKMGQELSSTTDLDELLGRISQCCTQVTHSESSSILLLDSEANEMYFKQVSGALGEVIQTIRIPLTENSIAGWSIIHKQPVLSNDVPNDPRHYKKVDEATSFITRTILAVPIQWGDRIFGVVEAVNKQDPAGFDDTDMEYLTILAHQAAVAINNVFMVEQLQNFFVHTVEILISALEALDPEAKGHIIRVARYSTAMARALGMNGKDFEQIWYGAYFHDIGKLSKEANFLNRKDRIHPVAGAAMIEQVKMLEHAAPIVRYHHEYYDGSGYPDGLSGEQIPLGARIIGLAEDYDEHWIRRNPDESDEEFKEQFFSQEAIHHDPKLVELFRPMV